MADILKALNVAYDGSRIRSNDTSYLTSSARNKLDKLMGDNVNVAYTILCVASAGQGQKKMEKAYNTYDDKANYYKKVSQYSQEAAEKQQGAVDKDGCTYMSSGMVRFCDNNGIGYSTKGGDKKHNEDEWQSLRDGLDYEKSIASTDMKMAGTKFDQAAKDCDSAQQLAVDGVNNNVKLFGNLTKSIY